MSLRIGRLLLEDPETWPEPIGEPTARVGGVAAPGTRGGVSISPSLTVAPPDSGARTDRERTRRQLRSLANNPPLRLRGLWVDWSEDDEQDAWMVPGQATIDLPTGGLASGYFTVGGLDLAVIGRPRTHRPAALARVRDLRLASEPKDVLGRVYGAAFNGTSGNGLAVTPAPLVWLPSDTQDVVVAGGGNPSYGATRQGRGASSLTAIQGATDLSVIHFEQDPQHRLRGDVVAYDRRGDTATSWTTAGPETAWEEVYGADWPWSGCIALDNSLCRIVETANGVLVWERWNGTAYAKVADLMPRFSNAALNTVMSRSVIEWTPDRVVVRLVAHAASTPGSRAEVFVTLQRGWLGPRLDVYVQHLAGAQVAVLPVGGVSANTVPASFAAAVNSGAVTSPTDGITVAVTHPGVTSIAVTGGVAVVQTDAVSVRLERCPTADVAAAHPVLGADVLAATQYPQTIVAR